MSDVIYFDHNSTTPMPKEVREAMLEIMEFPMNSSSIHSFGRRAKRYLEKARSIIRNFLNISNEYNIIFTSSGTESNNLALKGVSGVNVITSEIEHPSVLNVVGSGIIPVDEHGIVSLGFISNYLKRFNGDVLLSVMLANNETGVIQPIKEISEIVHKNGGIFHVDAVQAPGKIPVDLENLGVDMMTISAHKFGGPVGAAALIAKKKLDIKPIILGGGQEHRLRSGTQNILAIHGFGVACTEAIKTQKDMSRIADIRDYIEREIKLICPETIFFGQGAERLPNTSSIGMPGVTAESQVIHFDMNGVLVSAGSACSSGTTSLPHVQMAMGYSKDIASTALRISLGKSNTKEDADIFIKLWQELCFKSKENKLKKREL